MVEKTYDHESATVEIVRNGRVEVAMFRLHSLAHKLYHNKAWRARTLAECALISRGPECDHEDKRKELLRAMLEISNREIAMQRACRRSKLELLKVIFPSKKNPKKKPFL